MSSTNQSTRSWKMMKVAVFRWKRHWTAKKGIFILDLGRSKRTSEYLKKMSKEKVGCITVFILASQVNSFLQPAVHAHVVVLFSFAELLQTQPLDSREVADLLRQVSQSFRFQNSASMFKFEKVEIVNNDELRQKVNCCPCIICASVLTFQLCYIWPLKSGHNSSIIILFILACR